jgi:hypothetical protein
VGSVPAGPARQAGDVRGRRASGCGAARSQRGHACTELGKIAGGCGVSSKFVKRFVWGFQQFVKRFVWGSHDCV